MTTAAFRNRRESRVGVDMATTGAILELQYVVVDHRRFDLLVRALLEIAGMAAGAVRFIPCELPGNDLVVVRMAGATQHAGSVGFVERALVCIGGDRYPGDAGAVTGITRLRGDEVTR